jgi:hypothetical protein
MRLEEHTVERKRNHFQREVGEPNIKAAGKSCGYGLFPELHISLMNNIATHGVCPLSRSQRFWSELTHSQRVLGCTLDENVLAKEI